MAQFGGEKQDTVGLVKDVIVDQMIVLPYQTGLD